MTQVERLGRYRITGELGQGAMGVVYQGVDPSLDRQVAIKVISARHAAGTQPIEELEARFLREAKVSARINHPGVVTVFDAGREGDALYIVMELIDGESLAQRVVKGRYPTAAESLEMCARVGEALAAAHGLGVIHRDVKPANIMLCRDGRVKVADFGVAKAVGEGTDLTRTGTVVGSPAYMAPEQVRGEQIDGRADLFSLGVVLYELLLKRRPFPADTFTTLIFQILHEDPFADAAAFRSLGEPTAAFLRSCLAKDPKERIPDGIAFAAGARALIPLAGGPTVTTAPAVAVSGTTSATAPLTAVAGTAAQTAVTGVRVPPPVISTSPTRILPAAGVTATAPPPPPAAAPPPAVAPPPPPASRTFPVVPAVIFGGGLLAIVLAVLLLGRRPAPPAGEVLLGQAEQPTAAPAVQVPRSEQPIPTAVATAATLPAPSPTAGEQEMAVPTAAVVGALEPEPVPTLPPTPTPPVVAVFTCSKGAEFNVSPEDAQVAIDGKVIGIADDWDNKGGGKTYVFPGPGTYYARLTLKGYATTWVKIVVTPDASDEVADIDTEMAETKSKE